MTGYKIQVSMDGQGHSWQTIADGTHVDQVLDIECEIIDGGQESGTMTGTNGLLYRWMPVQDSGYYMNVETGSVDTRDGWDYETDTGETVNAVDLGEVVEVEMIGGEWVTI